MIGLSGLRVTGLVVTFYTALLAGANPVLAAAVPDAPRAGDMRKAVLHDQPVAVSSAPYFDLSGDARQLDAWKGRVSIVNFWATWCAPCRAEMPSLDALAAAYEGQVNVVAIATGRNPRPALDRFMTDAEITRLPVWLDPKSALAREMGVVGLPVTVILDADGQEIGRLTGEADWNSPDAHALIDALIAGQPQAPTAP